MRYFRLPCGFLLVEWDLGWGCWAWLWCLLAGRGALEALQQLPHMNHNGAGVSASVLCVKKLLPGRDGWWPSGVSQLAAGVPVCGDSWAWAALCPSDTLRPLCCTLFCLYLQSVLQPGLLQHSCSAVQKSGSPWTGKIKCLFLVLHNQVLTFKLVTYVVDLSKCFLAFISKFSKACKAGQAIQNLLLHCNKSINTV